MGSVNELKCYKVKREKSSHTNSAVEFFKVNTSFPLNLPKAGDLLTDQQLIII